MPAELAAGARSRTCFAPRRRSESRGPRFVPGLFALSPGLSRFRSAADPAPRRSVYRRPRPAADSTRLFGKMRIRVARRRFVPVLFSLSLTPRWRCPNWGKVIFGKIPVQQPASCRISENQLGNCDCFRLGKWVGRSGVDDRFERSPAPPIARGSARAPAPISTLDSSRGRMNVGDAEPGAPQGELGFGPRPATGRQPQ